MNYYIQGNAANAQEIKAAFESKGFIPRLAPMYYGSESVLFFTGIDNYIYETSSPWLIDIIKTHPDYKELELPVEPKFKAKDWVVSIKNPVLLYGILESNIPNKQGTLDYEVEIYAYGIYRKTCLISSNKIDEWGRHWTIQDARDGDVLICESGWTCIFKKLNEDTFDSHCFMSASGDIVPNGSCCHTLDPRINGKLTPTTVEQRILFFKKLQEAGYQWYNGKKELKKIQSHYDTSNFRAGMPVLVRDDDDEEWNYLLFSHYRKKGTDHFFAGGNPWFQCIPFNEDTEHLLGTTDMPSEEFINW